MHQFREKDILEFEKYLYIQERTQATIRKYRMILTRFYHWLPEEKQVTKNTVILYKDRLMTSHAPAGVNVILAALKSFFRFRGWDDCCVKPLRIQRKAFSDPEKELTKKEYYSLVEEALNQKDDRLALILQLMGSTGIRVSEIPCLTVEALKANRIQIHLKSKIRTILLPGKLCRKIQKYCRKKKICSGPVFLGNSGKPLDRRTIWAQMKRLCKAAHIPQSKVFPHNLRHLFARTFYNAQKDIAKLADLLGHSSIETTRIYLLSSGQEHRKMLDTLCMVY